MKTKRKRNIFSVLVVLSFLLTLFSLITPQLGVVNTKAGNPASWVMCSSDDGKAMYNSATTDLVPYSLRSKSNVARTENMDSFLNLILNVSGFNFDAVNKSIIGRDIVDKEKRKTDDKSQDNKKDETSEPTVNQNDTAPKVTPFDRFGMAGLKWSSYSGEWKYYEVDGCKDDGEVSETEYGLFYKNRKEPKSSFNETAGSKDPRVIQYTKGSFFSWSNAFNNMITNGLFSISKVVVTITIALLGLSFSDVTTLIGLGDANGSNGLIGLFENLYTGFFTPLVILAFLFTAVYVMYYGLIKRQIRQALISGLGQTIFCMFMAIVIGSAPAFWIPIPNQVATFGQSLIVSSLGVSTKGQNTLCGTNVGALDLSKVDAGSDTATQTSQMAAISNNMRSTVGCRLWEEFLFKPWTRGQFGVEYEDLVVGGAKGAKLQNINSEWTKQADVPLGGGEVEHNLALFQLSSQTEAHAQIDPTTGLATDPKTNKIQQVDGISSDWWRVADILSNYDEHKVSFTPAGGKDAVETDQQVDVAPLTPWQSWIGNHQSERYGIAVLSILFGTIGCIAPIVFGALTTIYSVGVTFLMAISPVFFLLGCWAGTGQNIFRGWAASLLSTLLKKIVSAGLLILSFAITISTMNLINVIGWIKAFLLLSIMTYVLIKNRKRIYDIFSQVNLGSTFRPDQMFSNFVKEKTKWTDEARLIGQSAFIGARQAKKQGMSMKSGASIAMAGQMKNTLRKTQMGRAMQQQMGPNNEPEFCSYCSAVINKSSGSFDYYMDNENNIVCSDCARDMGLETELIKINGTGRGETLTRAERDILAKRAKDYNKNRGIKDPNVYSKVQTSKDQSKRYKDMQTSNSAWLSYGKTQSMAHLSMDENEKLHWDNKAVNMMIYDNLSKLDEVASEYSKLWAKYQDGAVTPSVPEPINKYISTALVNEAWRAGNYDLVRDETITGWQKWYSDNSLDITNLSEEERDATIGFINDLRKTEPIRPKEPNNRFIKTKKEDEVGPKIIGDKEIKQSNDPKEDFLKKFKDKESDKK